MRTYRSGRPLSGFAARNAAKTHCPAGHEYTPENTSYYPNEYGRSRYCKACRRERERRRRAQLI